MHIFYSVFIHFYGIILHLAAFFNLKARKWCDGRKNWQTDLINKLDKKASYCWIHCASAGEFEQAIPLIKQLRLKNNDLKYCVSFFSPSGFEMYKDSVLADVFFYFPLDTRQNAATLIKILQPCFVIFIRNEIWMNILTLLHKKNIPVFLVNANLEQKRNFIYQKYLNKNYLHFRKIFDTKTYGNTKLEKVVSNKEEIFEDKISEDFCKDSFVIILGSSWQTEESLVALFYKKYCLKYPNLKIIIAPHEFEENTISRIVQLFTDSQVPNTNEVITYSQNQSINSVHSILILNKTGILKYAYRYADIALIGGGFDKGVHNITEAAVYGIPTLFGCNYQQFEEVIELVNLQVAFPLNDFETLENKLLEFIQKPDLRNQIKLKSGDYFNNHRNVTEKIISEILLLKDSH